MFIDFVTVGAFAVICLIVFLIGETVGGGRRIAKGLAKSVDRDSAGGSKSRPVVGSFTTALAGVVPQGADEVKKIERDLKRAGYYRSTALVEYMATRNGLIVAIVITAGVLAVLADPNSTMPEMFVIGGLLTAAMGYSLPRMLLHSQANGRVDRIQKGLPDALDIIRMCLTGGLPLREALERVSHEIEFHHPDIAVEFAIIHRHADAASMTKALRQFANRVDAPDISAMAAIVTQTERLGTHVATAVADYADSVRRAFRQLAEERASKTSIRMLFPVVLCLAPPIYILLCGPPVLKLRSFLIESHQPGGLLDAANYGERITPEGVDLLRRDGTPIDRSAP